MPKPERFPEEPRGRFLVAVGFMAFLTLGVRALEAQTVRGRLLEMGTGNPIASGVVVLLDTLSAQVDRAEADEDGWFTLEASEPGSYFVRAEALGYRPKMDGILELGEGGHAEIAFYLRPQPIELDPLEARGERDLIEAAERRYLEWQGFYDRMEQGFGHHITPEELEERPPWDYQDLFRKIPGVRAGERSVQIRSSSMDADGYCSPAIYINGLPTSRALETVTVNDIAAVEVYTRISSMPIQYLRNSCGVILIWTK